MMAAAISHVRIYFESALDPYGNKCAKRSLHAHPLFVEDTKCANQYDSCISGFVVVSSLSVVVQRTMKPTHPAACTSTENQDWAALVC